MGTLGIDGNQFRKMIITGTNELYRNRALIDGLNVFPVPDGDTGSNMSMTVLAAAREVYKLSTPNVGDVAKAAANGALRGARGNSGVILSQLFRGISKGLANVEVAGCHDLAEAFVQAAEMAYKAVMKPKEGTILTLARGIGEQALQSAEETEDIEEFLGSLIEYGNEILSQTQFMLAELKQAGVVDAGAKGALSILDGALRGMNETDEIEIVTEEGQPAETGAVFTAEADIKYAYCTEFFINSISGQTLPEDDFKRALSVMGDSIVVVSDEGLTKIHVHTNHPGAVLEKSIVYGSLTNIKIENMREQHTSMINFSTKTANAQPKETGIAAVASGAGIRELFISLGADAVIEGGQSMNPSAEDILEAVENMNAESVIILPNNKNIILTAEQAAGLCGREVIVIPTKSIPQGISAMVGYLPGVPFRENAETMNESIGLVKTGQVTAAIRSSTVNGNDINEGDGIGMLNGDIVAVNPDMLETAKSLVDSMMTGSEEIISIFTGEDASPDQSQTLYEYVRDNYPNCETELIDGGQPVYHYIISAE